MMAITHAIVGVAIASKITNPVLSAGLIITSHYLMDLIPHWDFGTDWKKRSVKATGILAIADTLVACILPFFLFYQHNPWVLFPTQLSALNIFLAICWANLPDWMEAPYFLFFASKEGHDKARGGYIGLLLGKIHGFQEKYIHTTASLAQGITTQVATTLFFLVLCGAL